MSCRIVSCRVLVLTCVSHGGGARSRLVGSKRVPVADLVACLACRQQPLGTCLLVTTTQPNPSKVRGGLWRGSCWPLTCALLCLCLRTDGVALTAGELRVALLPVLD